MDISFGPAKRAKCLAERDLDFAAAGLVFTGDAEAITILSPGKHPEPRFLTVGLLRDRYVIPRRGIHDKERRRYLAALGRS